MQITSNFDSGNIEVLDASDPKDVQLAIRFDAGDEHMQWFHFRVTGARDQALHLRFTNADKASYLGGWKDYQACASYDREHWFRVPTSFANDDHGSDPWSFYIKVLGTKGSARYSYNDFVDNSKHMVHSHSYQAYPYTIYAQAEHFIDQCVRNRRLPLSSLQDAATSLRILEAAETSIRESRHVAL